MDLLLKSFDDYQQLKRVSVTVPMYVNAADEVHRNADAGAHVHASEPGVAVVWPPEVGDALRYHETPLRRNRDKDDLKTKPFM